MSPNHNVIKSFEIITGKMKCVCVCVCVCLREREKERGEEQKTDAKRKCERHN